MGAKRLVRMFVCAVLATGCLPAAGTYGSSGYTTTTGGAVDEVVVNGRPLAAADKAKLDWLLGYSLPAGSYFVTDDGMMGVVGQPPTINLIAYAEARGLRPEQPAARGSTHYNGYSGDAITSDGNGCTIVSSGSLTYASGC